jgi:tetratricopeptide (TPR) repeat protein
MLRSRRREIHAQITKALMRLQPAIAETAPETLATHLARAGDDAGAAEYWQKAGSSHRGTPPTERRSAHTMSKQDRAFVDVTRALASAYFAAGEHELNRKHLAEAAAAAEAGGDPVTVRAMLGHAHALDGEFDAAVAPLETALERSQEIHKRYPASFTVALLAETLAPRQPRRALVVAETTLGAARASGHRAVEVELLRVKASAPLSLDAEAAEAAANEGYELAQKLDLGPRAGPRIADSRRHHGR